METELTKVIIDLISKVSIIEIEQIGIWFGYLMFSNLINICLSLMIIILIMREDRRK